MKTNKGKLLSSTVVPLAIAAGLAMGAGIVYSAAGAPKAEAASPAKSSGQPAALPAAQPKPRSQQLAAGCNPCNPCATKKNACNPCNPCAAAKCSPCNPCAAANPCSPCNPCNPCAAGGGKSACFVPRLQKAAGCNPNNPCAAAKRNPCNPCAAANPCNPCAAANPCNPCAAANPCNPCAAANPCNPCNPCAAGGGAELSDEEAAAAYDCAMKEMQAAYGKSGNEIAASYQSWRLYSRVPYVSYTHGERYVTNYANSAGKAYGAFENAGVMPEGAVLAKDSFSVGANGQVSVGPLFIMEKMGAGFNSGTNDWRYSMIMPNGSVLGVTGGAGSDAVQFCADCHLATDTDSMMFLPEEYRVK